jgi:predicted ATPase
MYKIKKVTIKGFWGEHTIITEFNQDVTIFIGRNGTGKTTFINLLQSVITVDLEMLYNLQFETIELILINGKKTKKILVSKLSKDFEYRALEYKISTSKYELPILSERDLHYSRQRTGRLHPKFYRAIEEIKEKLANLINLSYLSVHRENALKVDSYRERDSTANSIDLKLQELMSELTSYQLQLETELGSLSKLFQVNVLKSLLFNKEFDYVDINEPIKLKDLDLKKIRVGLKQAYKGLGILDEETTKIIEEHTLAISSAVESINKHAADPKLPLYPNDVTPLTLLRRTRKIIDLSIKLEKNKTDLFTPINKYLNLLNEYNFEKDFKLNSSKNLGLQISKDGQVIPTIQLSSGEKQLIILLTESLLQKNKQTIFIADEPELSLHIEWQRRVIPSIKELNPNAQVIIATHSPEIVGKWKSNAINMENIYG